MPDHADVRSLERLEEFEQQLMRLRQSLLKTLEDLQLEVRRLSDWIERDARAYWLDQYRAAQRHRLECREALSRCMATVRADERRPCTEQKQRLARADARVRTCQEKLRAQQFAAASWRRVQTKEQARMQRCQDMAETGLMVALERLRNHLETLRRYAELRVPMPRSMPAEPSIESEKPGAPCDE
ncbi:MAG: hypothetical protein D6753_18025 [Planctomycetota bacterium]|nr:MAG: hypothetical protein D6753_18025 [Planctomycetota bacterium]